MFGKGEQEKRRAAYTRILTSPLETLDEFRGGGPSMEVLSRYFGMEEWRRLRPAPGLVSRGAPEGPDRVAAAATEEGDWAVIYHPSGEDIQIDTTCLGKPVMAGGWIRETEVGRVLDTTLWRWASICSGLPATGTGLSTFGPPGR